MQKERTKTQKTLGIISLIVLGVMLLVGGVMTFGKVIGLPAYASPVDNSQNPLLNATLSIEKSLVMAKGVSPLMSSTLNVTVANYATDDYLFNETNMTGWNYVRFGNGVISVPTVTTTTPTQNEYSWLFDWSHISSLYNLSSLNGTYGGWTVNTSYLRAVQSTQIKLAFPTMIKSSEWFAVNVSFKVPHNRSGANMFIYLYAVLNGNIVYSEYSTAKISNVSVATSAGLDIPPETIFDTIYIVPVYELLSNPTSYSSVPEASKNTMTLDYGTNGIITSYSQAGEGSTERYEGYVEGINAERNRWIDAILNYNPSNPNNQDINPIITALMEDSYGAGFTAGEIQGLNTGSTNGYSVGYAKGYEDGELAMYAVAYELGVTYGTAYGKEIGRDDGISIGRQQIADHWNAFCDWVLSGKPTHPASYYHELPINMQQKYNQLEESLTSGTPPASWSAGFNEGYKAAEAQYAETGSTGVVGGLSSIIKTLADSAMRFLNVELMGISLYSVFAGLAIVVFLGFLTKIAISSFTS